MATYGPADAPELDTRTHCCDCNREHKDCECDSDSMIPPHENADIAAREIDRARENHWISMMFGEARLP